MRTNNKIPEIVYTELFAKYIQEYVPIFMADRRMGRALREHDYMMQNGSFTPANIRRQYVYILKNCYDGNFLAMQAYWYIGINAYEAACRYAQNNFFQIKVITGEIALDDDGDELTGLSFDEALAICKSLNEEAEEILFRVYDTKNNLIY